MARQCRMLVDDGVYHIIGRGHNRYKLFHSFDDYKTYKGIMRDYKKLFSFDLYHYCLMPNHMHILLKVLRGAELPAIMQGVHQTYAKYYKKKYGLIGNLFQGRYKGLIIDRDEYLLECGRYIERNPLRADMIRHLSEYHFSSYNFYAEGKDDDILTMNPLYLELASDVDDRMKLYKDYLMQKRPYENIVDQGLKI